jgi:site-specific DNA-methyltransferase (adenine-specific)
MWNGMCREGKREVEGKKRVHPTQKPVGMLGDILKDFSKEGQSVLDLFGGSGSTLIACEQLNRKCYMMELDPHYCDVIIARWEKLTGQKATRL